MSEEEGRKLHEQVCELVGRQLGEAIIVTAGKLLAGYEKEFHEKFSAVIETFRSEIAIALGESPNKDKVTAMLGLRMTEKIGCTMLAKAADLAMGTTQSISEFVGHSAEHYQQAQSVYARRKVQEIVNSVFAPMEEEMTKAAAEAHSPHN